MKSFLVFIINILLLQNVIFAQCCGAGNPISVSTSDNTIEAKKMKVGLNYRFSFSDTYYEEMHKTTLEFPTALKNSNYNYLNLNLGYGITKRLSASISLGYYINKTETFKSEVFGKLNGSGIGDLDLSISYKAYVNSRKGIELAPYFNVKFPSDIAVEYIFIRTYLKDFLLLPLIFLNMLNALNHIILTINTGIHYFFRQMLTIKPLKV